MIFEDSNVVKASFLDASLDSYLKQVELSKKKDMTKSDADRLYEIFKNMTRDFDEEEKKNLLADTKYVAECH